MRWAAGKAREIIQKYGSEEPELLALKLGCEIYEILEARNIHEVYFPDLAAIALKTHLDPYERNYLIAHALGHHLLHRVGANRDFIHLHEEGLFESLELGRCERARKEQEADCFAAYLLIPEEKLNRILSREPINDSWNLVPHLAEEFQVPEELVRIRLEFTKDL